MRVLVPLDGSAHATHAVSQLLSWEAWIGEMQLDLVHVAPQPPERATRDARALLHIARLGHRLHEAVGEPAAEIARLARQLGSDLIVMGTRGLGALHHALIGSVALKVAHASPVPVALAP